MLKDPRRLYAPRCLYHIVERKLFRGLNLAKEADHAILFDNKLGQMEFDGGLPCLLCLMCLKDMCTFENTLKDPRQLYAPGRLYHIVERKPFRGLNLAKEANYTVLLDNKLGQTKFDGGYVNNGLLKAAQ
ncbi:hypothetical protein Q3G72_031376 [Acer saccharum]|nr:hypothetical protein Q3G72_031376 [Acer saccharum]